ncbi:hypothetical protein EX895_005972 [Sporisorium graminicola]|uniref:Uncharacterized protein n=1 Tax=Sporisorium graminicola TaxID=280036 RepID=A0A4U7KPJ3_9BASI|nr:hypothetical protein EX895_005972 [Sporisorium graminicola]TKY84892.1 hypothetical protein EX895_005972 [Sporisorium graminicola]
MPLGFYGTHPSPHLPVLDGVRVGVHAGLPAYGRTQPALANPILEHQPPQLPLGSEVPPTFDASATPSQKIDHVASPEEAAGPSKPPVDEEASSSKLVGATKGFTYRTVLHPDPEVDAFIAAMRERVLDSDKDAAHQADGTKQIQLPPSTFVDPDVLAINTFWRRTQAKELLMLASSRQRRLFVTYNLRPRFLSHLASTGFVGVWELGPLNTDSLSSFFLHGFYPFTMEEFGRLAHQPEASGDFWFTVRRRTSGLSLSIDRMSSKEIEEEAGRRRQYRGSLTQVAPRPWRQVDSTALVSHSYRYQEDPQIVDLIAYWSQLAGLRKNAFIPIHLNEAEQKLLSRRMDQAFRFPRHVKLVTFDSGPPLMLCFHQNLLWLPQYKGSTMTVWSFGRPEVTADGLGFQGKPYSVVHRTMYATGVFHTSRRSLNKLSPTTVRGLQDSTFQYDRLDVPHVQPT